MQPEDFLRDIDAHWRTGGGPLPLRIIGSAALFLQTAYDRGTKDSDVWETRDITPQVKSSLLHLAGKDSPLHKKHRVYLDIVPNGLPFLPSGPRFHAPEILNKSLKHIRVEVLDIVDVVVSKLARFNANDAEDVSEMIRRALVPHGAFLRRFRSAVECTAMGAGAGGLPAIVKRFNTLERDQFHAPETEIELPDWI